MINQQIGNYKFLSVLGEGGMATVYLAQNTMLDSLVAIKVLKEEFVHNINVRSRFLDEAKKMVKVKHPNIILVMDLIDLGEVVAIVMEYVEGKSLKDLIERKGKLDHETVESLLRQMLSALDHIHQLGYVHRDIKPSNFMLGKDGTIKLADFGIAKDKNALGATETGTQMGTPMYMSPEQIKSTKNVDHRSDIYSLGVVLYEMVTGCYPFDNNTLSIPEIQVCILRDPLPTTHTFWDKHIIKATAKIEAERFQSCEEWELNLNEGGIPETQRHIEDRTILEKGDSDRTLFQEQKNDSILNNHFRSDFSDKLINKKPFYKSTWFRIFIILVIPSILFFLRLVFKDASTVENKRSNSDNKIMMDSSQNKYQKNTEDLSKEAKVFFSNYLNTQSLAELNKKSIPTYEDCKIVFKEEADALLFYNYIQKSIAFLNGLKPIMEKQPYETFKDLKIESFSSEEILNSSHIAGGMKRILKKFQKGIIFFDVSFLRKEGDVAGIRFSFWVNIDNRWVLFPKPWQAFPEIK